jgi:colicin import membrane protein
MTAKLVTWFSVIAATALLSVPALGQAPPPPTAGGGPAGKPAPKKEALKEKLKEKREELKEKREDLKEKRDDLKDAARDNALDLKERWQKLRETRVERRKERRDEIKKKWGELEKKPAVRAELKVHAWRMARLKRLRAIAEADGKTDTVARIDKLVQKENERHEKHMQTLKEKGGAE